MPRYYVTFEAIEGGAGVYDCCICCKNPATLRCSSISGGPCCLQCAFSILLRLAEETVDRFGYLAS